MMYHVILEVVEESIHKQHRNECPTQTRLRSGGVASGNDRSYVKHNKRANSL
jgi:hypothetical protein